MRSIWRSLKKTGCNDPTVWTVPFGYDRKTGHKKANSGGRKTSYEATVWIWNKILSGGISILTSVTIPRPPPALKLCNTVAYNLSLKRDQCNAKKSKFWLGVMIDLNLYLTAAEVDIVTTPES